MKKPQAVLLGDTNKELQYKIQMVLSDRETADFYYSNQNLAQSHYDAMSGTMNMGGLAIKTIKFEVL